VKKELQLKSGVEKTSGFLIRNLVFWFLMVFMVFWFLGLSLESQK